MSNMNIIEAVGVTKSFYIGELHVDAVRGIDLGVRQGELLAIVGPSGSGKSTLLNLLDGISESKARERAYGALELVDLAKRHDHVPSMMSGGEQQRVAVARALVIEPAIVLAAEHTGNLDSVNSAAVMRLLRDLVETRGYTVIMVTHDNAIAAQADRTVHVRDGKHEDGD